MVELKLDLLSLGALERKEFQICVKYAAYIEGQGVILLPCRFVGHWPIHFSHCSIYYSLAVSGEVPSGEWIWVSHQHWPGS